MGKTLTNYGISLPGEHWQDGLPTKHKPRLMLQPSKPLCRTPTSPESLQHAQSTVTAAILLTIISYNTIIVPQTAQSVLSQKAKEGTADA